jgi:uncharacterized protein YeeX (DUF496 family)
MYIDEIAYLVKCLIVTVVILLMLNIGTFIYFNNKISTFNKDISSIGIQVESRFEAILDDFNKRLSEMQSTQRDNSNSIKRLEGVTNNN